MESVKPFLALPEAEVLANSTTTQSHLKPIHFAVEGKSEELVRLLVDLTTEFKGQDAKTVMATVQKQFDAGNPAAAKEKPVTQLTHAQRPAVRQEARGGSRGRSVRSNTRTRSSTSRRRWQSTRTTRGVRAASG